MYKFADIMVVSKTPYEDLANYWDDQGIDRFVQVIAGQEMGSKGQHIEVAKKAGGYANNHILMLGDGNGDLKAVKENSGMFYPIIPGREQQCWNEISVALDMFKVEKYMGGFEDKLLDEFQSAMLSIPPWEEERYEHRKAYLEMQPLRKKLYERFNPDGRLAAL